MSTVALTHPGSPSVDLPFPVGAACTTRDASASDRRHGCRVDLNAPALVCATRHVSGMYLVENLSLHGALLVGHPALRPGTRLRMLLLMPGHWRLRLDAEVTRQAARRAGEPCFAVAFDALAPAAQDAIHDLILAALEKGLDR